MKRINAFLHSFPLSILLGLLIGPGLFYYLERPYLSYENLPFPPTIQVARAGERIPLLVRRCNSSNKVQVYNVAHSLHSEDPTKPGAVLEPNDNVPIEPGCSTSTSMINRIPENTVPGRYYIVGVGIIDGFFGQRLVPWYSQPFEVTR